MNKRLLLSLVPARRFARSGFTIAELLIGSAVGSLLLTGMMYMVVQMTQMERTQTARGETEREITLALDYIASELRQAVLVYDRDCLGVAGTGQGASCPGLALPVNTVLAFWKREEVPDLNFINNIVPQPPTQERIQQAIEGYANGCLPASECQNALNFVRTQYTLVSYVLCPNDGRPGPNCGFTTGIQPRGPARIVRGYFRQFAWGTGPSQFQNRLVGLEPLDNPTWPAGLVNFNAPNANSEILLANVDWQPNRVNVDCPAGYVSSTGATGATPTNTGFRSFYACVRQRTGATETGFAQDVFLHLRGNAAERAGKRAIEATGTNLYRPAVETQVRTRGSHNRVPS